MPREIRHFLLLFEESVRFHIKKAACAFLLAPAQPERYHAHFVMHH